MSTEGLKACPFCGCEAELFGRVASVTVEEYKIGQANPSTKDTQDLEPGQSREVYVHASRRVVITENADATRDDR